MILTFLAIAGLWFVAAGAATWVLNTRERRRALREVRGRAGVRTPILMPVCARPHYLRQVLAALSQVEDIDRALLVFSQDGRNAEVAKLIAGIEFAEVIILRHSRPFLGTIAFFWDSLHAVSVNIRFLLDFAFSGLKARYAIVLEDDLVPSPDFLRYFDWVFKHILADERVLSVTGFNLHSRLVPGEDYDPRDHPCDIIENRENGQPKFTGWSWAITRSIWHRIRGDWSLLSWDIRLDETQRKLGLISYKPALGRVRNIGMQGGINFTEQEGNPKWTGITVSDKAPLYETPPRILAEDPVNPTFLDPPSQRLLPNERERNLIRRVWLGALIAAAALLELLLRWRF